MAFLAAQFLVDLLIHRWEAFFYIERARMKIAIQDIKIGNRYRKQMGDIQSLADSIKEQGLLQPIGLTKDKELVFGRRRTAAIKLLGQTTIEYRTVDVVSILDGEFTENTIRKDFTLDERVKIGKAIEEKIGERRGNPTKEKVATCPPLIEKTRDIVAKQVGFGSGRTYDRAKLVSEKASTEQKEQIDKGETSINAIHKKIRQEQKQEKLAEAQKNHEKEYKQGNKKPMLYIKDYQNFLNDTEDNSVDLLITDPPYFTEDNIDDSFVSNWVNHALLKLNPTGRAYIFIGAYPQEIHSYLDLLLRPTNQQFIVDCPLIWTYRNTLGQTPKMKYNLNYQICIHLYSNKSRPLDTSVTNEMFSVQDINAPDGRQGDRYYKWQKPDKLAKQLIRHSTQKNDIVIDPFAGSGTFLLAANQMGRIATGCEIDPKVAEIAKNRGCNVQR